MRRLGLPRLWCSGPGCGRVKLGCSGGDGPTTMIPNMISETELLLMSDRPSILRHQTFTLWQQSLDEPSLAMQADICACAVSTVTQPT